ncbi:MAG: hypothetical protein U1E30_11490 [Rhodoblastus sp.]
MRRQTPEALADLLHHGACGPILDGDISEQRQRQRAIGLDDEVARQILPRIEALVGFAHALALRPLILLEIDTLENVQAYAVAAEELGIRLRPLLLRGRRVVECKRCPGEQDARGQRDEQGARR